MQGNVVFIQEKGLFQKIQCSILSNEWQSHKVQCACHRKCSASVEKYGIHSGKCSSYSGKYCGYLEQLLILENVMLILVLNEENVSNCVFFPRIRLHFCRKGGRNTRLIQKQLCASGKYVVYSGRYRNYYRKQKNCNNSDKSVLIPENSIAFKKKEKSDVFILYLVSFVACNLCSISCSKAGVQH